MNTERFISKRIIFGSGKNNQLSSPITKIAVLGITLGLAVMILTVSIVTGFQMEIRNKLIGFGSHITIGNLDNNETSEPHPISKIQPFLHDLKGNPDIVHVQSFGTKSGIIKTKTANEGVVLKGVGTDYDWSFIKDNLKSGAVFPLSDTGVSKNVIISTYLADRLELKLNDKMIVYCLTKKEDSLSTQFEQRIKVFYVSGIYETGLEEIDKQLVLVDLKQIQKLNYWTNNQVGGFEVAIKDFKKIDQLGEYLNSIIGQGLLAHTVKETNPTVFSWLDMQDVSAEIVIVLMLLVAGINMISALLILILERTNMIGILKALGATNSSIQKIFLYNATYLIGKGLLFGNILGIAIALIQYHFGIFKLDQTTYYVSVIPIHLDFINILFLNLGTLLACLLMLILPSFIVSKITPIKAIRFS